MKRYGRSAGHDGLRCRPIPGMLRLESGLGSGTNQTTSPPVSAQNLPPCQLRISLVGLDLGPYLAA